MTLELKAGFTRYAINSLSPNYGKNASAQIGLPINTGLDASGLANFTLGTYAAIGDGSYLPTTNINNLYQIGGAVSYIVGSHSIKIGLDLGRRQVNDAQTSQAVGLYTFD